MLNLKENERSVDWASQLRSSPGSTQGNMLHCPLRCARVPDRSCSGFQLVVMQSVAAAEVVRENILVNPCFDDTHASATCGDRNDFGVRICRYRASASSRQA